MFFIPICAASDSGGMEFVMSFLGLMALAMFAIVAVGFFGAIFIAVLKLIFKLLLKIFR